MTPSKFRDRSLLVVVFLGILAAILIGCGGNGGSGGGSGSGAGSGTASGGSSTTSSGGGTGSTSMSFSLQWPASTRGIPPYALSVVLTAQNGSNEPTVKIVNRGSKLAYTQKVTFGDIPAGDYTISGRAYLDKDAEGPLVAEFTANLQVESGTQVEAPISFASTVASVVISGSPTFMDTGVTAEMTGHAVDTNDDILLLPPGSLQWSITTGNELAEITPVGFLSALAPGDIVVRLLDTTSGHEATTDITIIGEPITTGSTGTETTDTTGGSTTTDSTTTDGGTTGTTDTTGTTGTDTGGDTGATGGTGGTVGTGGTGTDENGSTS